MRELILLTDYKGNFGSKHNANPYNSGMNKDLLKSSFLKYDIIPEFIYLAEVMSYDTSFWKDKMIVYTSSEDTGYHYKSYIEDVIYYLELSGAKLIPPYKYLRANNNKVFMELLRKSSGIKAIQSITSKVFGSLTDMQNSCDSFNYPVVYKKAEGAMSRGVGIAYSKEELLHKLKKISRTRSYFKELREFGRLLKYKGYLPQSKYRRKFIIQDYIKGLNGDFKVLVFADKFYVLKRDAKKDDFRASGSGIRTFIKDLPTGLLNYADICIQALRVPFGSLDIGFDGTAFFLIEFQCIYFGSYTLSYSKYFWEKTGKNEFHLTEGTSILEEEFARSVINFKYLL